MFNFVVQRARDSRLPWSLRISEQFGYPWLDINCTTPVSTQGYYDLIKKLTPEEARLFEEASAAMPTGKSLVKQWGESLRKMGKSTRDFYVLHSGLDEKTCEFLLEFGEEFTGFDRGPRAYYGDQMGDGLCFSKATIATIFFHKFYYARYQYCEGMACSAMDFPLAHAWNSRANSARAVDYTWAGGDKFRYFGVRLPRILLSELIDRRHDAVKSVITAGALKETEKFLRDHLKSGVPV